MDPAKILVIRDGRLGDMLMITPVLRALHSQYPNTELHLLVGLNGARMVQHNPCLHQLHDYDRSAGLLHQLSALKALPGPFDIVVSLESSTHFAMLARVIPARRRLGFANSMDWLYDAQVAWDDEIHAIHNNLALARLAGVAQENCSTDMDLHLPPEDLELADIYLRGEGLGAGEEFAFLHPPCGPNDPLRPWPGFYYAELADRLYSELGLRALINGSPQEAHIVDSIVAQTTAPVLTNTDPSLSLMIGLIARSALFVSGNTGPLHMASALHLPIVALFGSTLASDSGPLGAASQESNLSANLPCSPCAHRAPPEKEKCLAQGFGDCMVAIDVDQVFEACRQLLAAR